MKPMKSKKKINLNEICDWSNFENVAIEYYSETHDLITASTSKESAILNCLTLNYLKIFRAQKALKNIILKNVKSSTQQFIGIHFGIPIYCIPSLILGIISAKHAFVFLSKDQLDFLVNSLEIKYLFIPNNAAVEIEKNKIIKKFLMHKECIIFSKIVRTINDNEKTLDYEHYETKNKNYLAYAITTSGSTGTSVPVKVSHASLLPNILDFRKLFKLSNSDKIAQLTPLTFDPSLVEIFLSFSSGATLVIISEHLKNDSQKLLNILYNKKITFISTTPSLFLHRGWSLSDLQSTLLGKDSNLQVLLLGGEVFPKLDIISKIKHVENCTRIFNVYGITEVSCWASIKEIYCDQQNNSDKQIQFNLGTVLSDTIFQVRDIKNDCHIINEGEGILYIGSNSRICVIGNEILNDLKLPVFRNSGDLVMINKLGEIIFKGRKDSCIKRFGHKVFLNDLNSHIQKLCFIKDSYSLIYSSLNKLWLFLTISEEFINRNAEIINQVWTHIKLLPTIMYPDVIHILNSFKMTEHGKICKQYLMNICVNIENKSSISNMSLLDIRILLEKNWINHLHCSLNNINLSRFIDSGGTSIIALQIFSELINKSERSFPNLVAMLLENKTLKECLEYIDECYNNIKNNSHNCDIEINNYKLPEGPMNEDLKNVYIWQKFRGKNIVMLNNKLNQLMLQSLDKFFIKDNFTIKDYQTFNLGKCVDASPTIFGYVDLLSIDLSCKETTESTFVCVGSHLGIICTVVLDNYSFNNEKKWEIQLPQVNDNIPRIEASILVLDEFKGIVGCHDGNIYCINLKTGEIYWNFVTNNIVKCSAVICSKMQNVFIGSYDHFFYCISAKNGSLIWKRKIYSSISSTPLVHNGTNNVIISLLNGMCVCLNQTSGDMQWEYRLKNPIFSSPVELMDDVVVIADVCGNLIGLKITIDNHHSNIENNCKKLWNFNISDQIFSDLVVDSPLSHHQNLIFTSKKGFLYKYYINNSNLIPKLKYKIDCCSMIVSTPWVDKNVIIIVCENGVLKILDYEIGSFLYTFKLYGDCFSSPVLHKNFITVGCRDDNLYILRLQKQADKKE